MTIKNNIYSRASILLAATALLTGCVDDKIIDCPVTPAGSVTLKIAVPCDADAATRANPAGGEDGDGREDPIANESRVDHFHLFFYKGDDGINAPANTPVKALLVSNETITADSGNSTVDDFIQGVSVTVHKDIKEYTITLKPEALGEDVKEGDTFNYITVANADFKDYENIATLGDLRDCITYGNAWTRTSGTADIPSNCDNFVMSTAYDKSSQYTSKVIVGNENSTYVSSALIQRLAARLDLCYDNANLPITPNGVINKLVYSIKDGNGKEKAQVLLTNVAPVNVMSRPSYLVKRVTESSLTDNALASLNLTYGGLEKMNGGVPSNYVVEPSLDGKKTVGENATASAGTGILWNYYGRTAASYLRNNTNATTVFADYAVENLYNYTYAGDDNYQRVMVVSYANENVQPETLFDSRFITGLALKAIFVPAEIITKYDNGVATTTAGTEGDTFYRYSPSKQNLNQKQDDLYFSNQPAVDAYKAAHPEDNAVVVQYVNGVCYYNIWLRHFGGDSDNTSAVALPMEFATVRNNIYRVKLSFSNIGDPTPEIREEKHVHSRIFVRKWNYREDDQIIL